MTEPGPALPAGLPAWAGVFLELLAWAGRGKPPPDTRGSALREASRRALPVLAARNVDTLHHLAFAPHSPAQRAYDAVWAAQRAEVEALLAALAGEGVETIVFKGAEHLARWWGGHSIGFVSDADLLVPRHRLVAAQKALYAAGFRPATYDPSAGELVDRDVADIAAVELHHYELIAFRKVVTIDVDDDVRAAIAARGTDPVWVLDGDVRVVVEVDVHHGVATDVASGPFFERAVAGALSGSLTMSAADHLWFTASRYYTELSVHGKESLRDLAYLAPLVARGAVAWDVVVAAAVDLDIRPSVYYLLALLDWTLGHPVPQAVLAELDPLRGSRLRDWGWQLGRLFGVVDPSPFAGLPPLTPPARGGVGSRPPHGATARR